MAYPFGASVLQAGASLTIWQGRIIVVGANYWASDGKTGFPGHDGQGSTADTTFQADSRRTVQAMVEWLTGKSSGATVFIQGVKSTPAAPCAVTDFGYQFSDGLEANGHTVTWSGSASSWSGYDPIDYDLFVTGHNIPTSPAYHGLTVAQDIYDFIIANNTSSLIHSDYTYVNKYGHKRSSGAHGLYNPVGTSNDIHIQASGYGPPVWGYQRPFTSSELGAAPSGGSWGTTEWALVMNSTACYGVYPDDASWTMGGTRSWAQCSLTQIGGHSDLDADGLYVLGFWSPS